MSFAGLCVRLIENADGYQILTFRGIAQAAVVWFVACFTRKIKPLQFVKDFDRTDVLIGALLSLIHI